MVVREDARRSASRLAPAVAGSPRPQRAKLVDEPDTRVELRVSRQPFLQSGHPYVVVPGLMPARAAKRSPVTGSPAIWAGSAIRRFVIAPSRKSFPAIRIWTCSIRSVASASLPGFIRGMSVLLVGGSKKSGLTFLAGPFCGQRTGLLMSAPTIRRIWRRRWMPKRGIARPVGPIPIRVRLPPGPSVMPGIHSGERRVIFCNAPNSPA